MFSADCQVRLSMFYLYLLNALVISHFPNFNLMCQENYVHHWLLMNMFGKPKNEGEKETVLTGG